VQLPLLDPAFSFISERTAISRRHQRSPGVAVRGVAQKSIALSSTWTLNLPKPALGVL
jgi:hypothetical protein